MEHKPYGSGYFGEWTEDEFGLPAYRYTCNQVSDPKAFTPTTRVWRHPKDHSFMVGNDRLVGVASNFGYLQLRQDEGAPKYLNDFDPEHQQYAGGFGYLVGSQARLCTYFTGEEENFARVFGCGYMRKMVKARGYEVDQVVFAPFGDDPLLISQVTIHNHSSQTADLRWIEYWGCRMYQLTYGVYAVAQFKGDTSQAAQMRRKFARYFRETIEPIPDGKGLLNRKTFNGFPESDQEEWDMVKFALNGIDDASVPGGAWMDRTPPDVFLVSLDGPASGALLDAQGFFGDGGPRNPVGLDHEFSWEISASPAEPALLLERRVHLAPGERRTLYFAYGYLPQGYTLEELLGRYQEDLPGAWARSMQAWKKDRIHLEIPGMEWIDRELAWSYASLRGGLSYSTFFQEHILSQGTVYQYIIGLQGAPRDQIQHAFPFVYSHPWIVKETLRYTLKEVSPDGELPYAITGDGMQMPYWMHPSDLELCLLWLTAEYVLANRDVNFLAEEVSTYPAEGQVQPPASVQSILDRCVRHLLEKIGVGEHGLIRLTTGDWNDAVVYGHVPSELIDAVTEKAESVLNTSMAVYTFDLYARMLETTGDPAKAASMREKSAAMNAAMQGTWNGRWFKRAWMPEGIGWVGDGELWLEPQPWAMLSGTPKPEQAGTLVKNIDELLRKPNRIGAQLFSQGIQRMEKESRVGPGILENGGVWPAVNGLLIWALARLDPAMAWDEYLKNMLAAHAEAFPEIWYGIWTGPDAFNSALSKYPGYTQFNESMLAGGEGDGANMAFTPGLNWVDFPVLCLHPHNWPLFDAVKLSGVEFNPEGLDLAPAFPGESFRLASPLLGLERTAQGYSGWYAPQAAGSWTIHFKQPAGDSRVFSIVVVNGEAQPVQAQGGVYTLRGESAPGKPLVWSLL